MTVITDATKVANEEFTLCKESASDVSTVSMS